MHRRFAVRAEFAHPDGRRVLTTRQVFELRDLPEHLVVLGAGPTGCEFADFFSRCGSRVTLISARDQLLPNDDPDLAEVLEEVFLRRGMDVVKNGRAAAIEHEEDDVVRLILEDGREIDVLPRALVHRHAPQHTGAGARVGRGRVRRARHAAGGRPLPHERPPRVRLR